MPSDVHRAVDDQRCRFLPALRVEIEVPRELQILDGVRIDRRERAETLLVIGAAVREPVSAIVRGAQNAALFTGAAATAAQASTPLHTISPRKNDMK